jgi:glucose-1-phosphate thymidylyltransferase
MHGVILAAGSGSRLRPLTLGTSKHLLAIYDKPMIYYPLTTLILAGVTNVCIVVNAEHMEGFFRLLGDGSSFGISITYRIQGESNGLVGALLAVSGHVGDGSLMVILGDNLFYGSGVGTSLQTLSTNHSGARLFCTEIPDPRQFGVVKLSVDGRVISLEEKPASPQSQLVATGLYFFDATVWERARAITPSGRGELEITDLNSSYLADGQLDATLLPRSTVWLDTGTISGLSEASEFVRVVQSRQNFKIGSPEDAAQAMGLL